MDVHATASQCKAQPCAEDSTSPSYRAGQVKACVKEPSPVTQELFGAPWQIMLSKSLDTFYLLKYSRRDVALYSMPSIIREFMGPVGPDLEPESPIIENFWFPKADSQHASDSDTDEEYKMQCQRWSEDLSFMTSLHLQSVSNAMDQRVRRAHNRKLRASTRPSTYTDTENAM